MDKTLHMVTLANGKQVSWEEFSTWSIFKQNGSLFPPRSPDVAISLKDWCLENSQLKSIAHKESFFKIRKITRNYGSKNGSSKAVMTPDGQFPSRKSAANHFRVSSRKMYDWIKSNLKPDFYYLENECAQKHIGNKPVTTPAGAFASIAAAARHYSVTPKTIKDWIHNKPESGFSFDNDSISKFLIPRAKPLMTSAGRFPSLKTASDHFDVQEATIKKWIIKGKPDFYFL